MRPTQLLGLLGALASSTLIAAKPMDVQKLFSAASHHKAAPELLKTLAEVPDVVDAFRLLHPEQAAELDEPRLLQVLGDESGARWGTEGDKLRMRREGIKFMDLTGHEDMVQGVRAYKAEEPHTPKLEHQLEVQEVIKHLDLHAMYDWLEKGSSFYNRFYKAEYGRDSSRWLLGEVLDIVRKAPLHMAISVETFTHEFPQSTIIARISPPMQPRNLSEPHTIIGAHQDSANYYFASLPAPGADDDLSGTVSILAAFAALVERGFTPERGPVEFHWYAAEEGGLLGSLAVAKEYAARDTKITAMMEYDMTAFVKKGSDPTVNIITTESNDKLTKWVVNVAKEYCAIPVKESELFKGAGSDYMSFTRYGYPATFGTEADPMAGLYDPFVHTAADRMDLKSGEFSIEHMREFSKLTVGFVVEQAGWKDSCIGKPPGMC